MSSRRTSLFPLAQGIEALVLDALSAEVCLLDRVGTILAVNKAWRDFARANQADETRVMEGENYLAVCDAAKGPDAALAREFGQGIRAVLAGARDYFELEYPCPSPDSDRWFLGRVTPLPYGGGAFAVVAHENVTERKTAKEALVKALRRLRGVMDTVPDLLYELDLDGNLIDWNRRFEEVSGYASEELKGRNALTFFSPEEQPLVAQAIRTKLEKGASQVEAHLLTKDGRAILFQWAGSVMKDEEGRVVGATGVGRDITESQAMASKLREQYDQLKELDRLKGNFVNAVTHELRTPLTSIRGYAEFLEDELGGPLTPDQLTYVHELQRGARRLESLLNDLLDFAKFEAGTFKLILREDDLACKIRESVESLLPQAREAQLRLVVTLPPEPICVRMDQQRIGQVLINLIGNAVKFSRPGGVIEVRASVERDQVRCEVMDTGIGVASEDLPKLFQRFVQLDPGVRKGTGAGLGLSISKAIVDAHGGRIGVQSRLDVGSTFWFTLPLSPRAD